MVFPYVLVCVSTQCVPSVATRVVAKIYRPIFCYRPRLPLTAWTTLTGLAAHNLLLDDLQLNQQPDQSDSE